MTLRIVAGLFATLLATRCAGEDQLIELNEFSVSIPASWQSLPDEKTLVTARGPLRSISDPFMENIRIKSYDLPKPATPDQLVAVQSTPEALESFKLLARGRLEGTKTPISWFAIAPKMPVAPKDDLAKIDYIAVVGKKAFVMHCVVETSQWEKDKDVFETIAKSLSFKK
jgi:hypothetical protein